MTIEITGLGIIHGLGVGIDKYWSNLISGTCSFSEIPASLRGNSKSTVGAKLGEDFCLSDFIERGKVFAKLWPRTIQLGMAAAILALRDCGVDIASSSERIGLVVGTGAGNLSTAFAFRDQLKQRGSLPPETAFLCFHHGIASVISAELDIRGPCFTISEGCSSGLDLALIGKSLVDTDQCDYALLVGVDNELTPEAYAALEGSNSLSSEFNDEPSKALRPFDKKRGGNVLGEGACAIFVERRDIAKARKARSYARLISARIGGVGGGRRYDAANPAPETKTFSLMMSESLKSIREESTNPRIAICANGSGSVLYDPIEARVISAVFGDENPPVFSIKGAVGQHGASSSAMQLAVSALAIQKSTIPGTINCDDPIDELGDLKINTQTQSWDGEYVICNSIGLGGFFYSCAILGKTTIVNNGGIAPTVNWGKMHLTIKEHHRAGS